MKYHGIEFQNDNEDSGVLRVGMLRFLEILMVEFYFNPVFHKENSISWPNRWIDKKFLSAIDKYKDTFFKSDRVAGYFSHSMKDFFSYHDSQRMEDFVKFQKAHLDIQIYLDILLYYLRIQADCFANCIPNLYGEEGRKNNIPRDSFRKQRKWFINKNPEFDPVYTKTLYEKCEWFILLSGEGHGQGIRDLNVHYRGKFHIISTMNSSGQMKDLQASLANESGYLENDVISLVKKIQEGYFNFLEASYTHFRNLISINISGELPGDIMGNSQLLKFSGGFASSWIYSIISNTP